MQTFLFSLRGKKDSQIFAGVHADKIPILEELTVLEELTHRNILVYTIFFDDQSEMFAELTLLLDEMHMDNFAVEVWEPYLLDSRRH